MRAMQRATFVARHSCTTKATLHHAGTKGQYVAEPCPEYSRAAAVGRTLTTGAQEEGMIGTTEARRRGSTLLAAIAVVGVFGAMAACSDDDDIIIPTAAVRTFADSSFNFATLHTFSMPDTVAHFAPLTGTPLAVSNQFDATILAQVRTDLLARGYTEVVASATVRPDFVVLTGVSATQNYNAFITNGWSTYWGYWTGWGWVAGGIDPSWTLIYPWYPVVGVTA